MIQPEPYDIVHEFEEPIITHHVAYREAGPVQERDTVRPTGLGQQVVGTTQEVGPLEGRYAGQQRIPAGDVYAQPRVPVTEVRTQPRVPVTEVYQPRAPVEVYQPRVNQGAWRGW